MPSMQRKRPDKSTFQVFWILPRLFLAFGDMYFNLHWNNTLLKLKNRKCVELEIDCKLLNGNDGISSRNSLPLSLILALHDSLFWRKGNALREIYPGVRKESQVACFQTGQQRLWKDTLRFEHLCTMMKNGETEIWRQLLLCYVFSFDSVTLGQLCWNLYYWQLPCVSEKEMSDPNI